MPITQKLIHGLCGAVLALLLVLSAGQPAMADAAADRAALDKLFIQLHDAPDAEAAGKLTDQIWAIWTGPSDPTLAARMSDVIEARMTRSPEVTLELLNELIRDFPDYAEGWNQRATLYYMLGDFEASIADCAKVLELEPRHFGALAGRAMMYLQLDKRSLALRDIQAALAIHPFLNERLLFPELQDQITRT